MTPHYLRRVVFGAARMIVLLGAVIGIGTAFAFRAEASTCLRILGYDADMNSRSGLSAWLADVSHAQLMRETRFAPRTEIDYNPVAGRALYVTSDGGPDSSAQVILQAGPGPFSNDYILQKSVIDQLEAEGPRRTVAWSADGAHLAYLWTGLDGNSGAGLQIPLHLSHTLVKDGTTRSVTLPQGTGLCCIASVSPDGTVVALRSDSDDRLYLWSLETLAPIDDAIRFTLGAWLPVGHTFVGIDIQSATKLDFLRWDGSTAPLRIPFTQTPRQPLRVYLAPDGSAFAVENLLPPCAPTQPCPDQTTFYDLYSASGEIIAADLPGLSTRLTSAAAQAPAPQYSTAATPDSRAPAVWSADSTRFLFFQPQKGERDLSRLVAFVAKDKAITTLAESVMDRALDALQFPAYASRFYDADSARKTQGADYILVPTMQAGSVSVNLVRADGSVRLPLVENVSWVSNTQSGYFYDGSRLLGWGLDGRTIIIPWVKFRGSTGQQAGITWAHADGSDLHTLDGHYEVDLADVMVDYTARKATRWLGFMSSDTPNNFPENFEMVNLDDGRHYQFVLPGAARSRSWLAWFSRDGRYVALGFSYRAARSPGNAPMALIDLQNGALRWLEGGYVAAWDTTGSQTLAYAHSDTYSGPEIISFLNPETGDERTLAVDNIAQVRVMSWNRCY